MSAFCESELFQCIPFVLLCRCARRLLASRCCHFKNCVADLSALQTLRCCVRRMCVPCCVRCVMLLVDVADLRRLPVCVDAAHHILALCPCDVQAFAQ